MKNALLIIGPDINTRGVGGVTVHVRRLLDYLEKNGYNYIFKDSRGNRFHTILSAMLHSEAVHLHISNPGYMYLLTLIGRLLGKKMIITVHGDYGRFGRFKNFLVRASIRLASVPVVINENSYKACQSLNSHLQLIPAFIPPQVIEPLPNSVVELLDRIHDEGRILYSTNASTISVDKQGNEIYGIDFLIHYFISSKDSALVISDPSGRYEKKYSGLQSDSVFFITEPHSYYEVLKRSDLSIRNTSTDGDSLSVKESLYLKVPTLCTDVVDRPDGVRLFRYCDKESFERCMSPKIEERTTTVENGADQILQIYRKLSLF